MLWQTQSFWRWGIITSPISHQHAVKDQTVKDHGTTEPEDHDLCKTAQADSAHWFAMIMGKALNLEAFDNLWQPFFQNKGINISLFAHGQGSWDHRPAGPLKGMFKN